MEELIPGVTVVAQRGEVIEDANYLSGLGATVKDGHLFVEDANGAALAIYPPGKWWSAVIDR